MTEQLALDGAAAFLLESEEKPVKPLTENQQLAFDYIRERNGVTVDEIGAFLHAHRKKRPHGVDERCEWCAKAGRQTVTSKGLAPLVTYRKAPGGRLYVARNPDDVVRTPDVVVEPTEAELRDNPFAGL